MATEIERKFLVTDLSIAKNMATRIIPITQAYLAVGDDEGLTVRVRITPDRCLLTIKSISDEDGISRKEWEYELPESDARTMMMQKLLGYIEKERCIVPYKGKQWEVDVFHDEWEGLVLAEIELHDPKEEFDIPPFIGKEVTGDPQYYNSSLGEEAIAKKKKR